MSRKVVINGNRKIKLRLHNSRRRSIVVLKGISKLDRSNWKSRKSRQLKWLNRRQSGSLGCSPSFGAIECAHIAFGPSCVRSRRVCDWVVLIHSRQIYNSLLRRKIQFLRADGKSVFDSGSWRWSYSKKWRNHETSERCSESKWSNLPTHLYLWRGPKSNWQTLLLLKKKKPGRQDFAEEFTLVFKCSFLTERVEKQLS